MDEDFLDFCVSRAEFENDILLWSEDFAENDTIDDQTRKRILMEELEDFDIPY